MQRYAKTLRLSPPISDYEWAIIEVRLTKPESAYCTKRYEDACKYLNYLAEHNLGIDLDKFAEFFMAFGNWTGGREAVNDGMRSFKLGGRGLCAYVHIIS